jgi:predicted nucleic acid-binding protein
VGYGQPLLLDWSAYARVLLTGRRPAGGRLTPEQIARFGDALAAGELAACAPLRIEARYSALTPADFAAISRELDALPEVPLDRRTWEIAEDAQRQLAETPGVSHRVKLPDLVIAAAADQHGLGVLHYDADYDTITENTTLTYRSRWIAERGTID